MAFNADQELRLIIKSVYDPQGAKASLGDLRILVEETRKGSKEAADALDHWRSSYGKLKDQLSNTGAGLAVDPSGAMNPPSAAPVPEPSSSEEGGGESTPAAGGRGMLRRMASAAGIGSAALVAYRAITSAVRVTKEWLQSIEEMARHQRTFEKVADTIDSIATQTRRANEHSKDFALSYAQIERQVHTVSAELQHLMSFQEAQANFEQRLDDARTQRQIKQIHWNNRFNEIQRIRETEQAEEQAFIRRVQREREVEERKLKALKLEQEMAAWREQKYGERAGIMQDQIPGLERSAEQDAKRAAALEAENKQKVDEMEKERSIVQSIASGEFSDLTLQHYRARRALNKNNLNPSTSASNAMLAITGGMSREQIQKLAQARLDELDADIGTAGQQDSGARSVADSSRAEVERAKRKRGMYEDEALRSKMEQEKAKMESDAQQKLMRMIEGNRDSIQSETIRGMQIQRDIDVQGAMTGGQKLSANNATLDDVVQRLDQVIRIWG